MRGYPLMVLLVTLISAPTVSNAAAARSCQIRYRLMMQLVTFMSSVSRFECRRRRNIGATVSDSHS
jgi:hypothetical protein